MVIDFISYVLSPIQQSMSKSITMRLSQCRSDGWLGTALSSSSFQAHHVESTVSLSSFPTLVLLTTDFSFPVRGACRLLRSTELLTHWANTKTEEQLSHRRCGGIPCPLRGMQDAHIRRSIQQTLRMASWLGGWCISNSRFWEGTAGSSLS
jgi:hypothetical protein